MITYLFVLAFLASRQASTAVYTDSTNFSRNESYQEFTLHRYIRQSECRNNQWGCGDGSCIPLDGKCDGVVDCPDASDEIHTLCQHLLPSKCVLPPFPTHGSYTYTRPTLSAVTLTVTCDPPYRLDGPAQVNCYNGQWFSAVPQCKRFCKLTPHLSVTYACKTTDPNILNGERKCNEYEPDGTEVHPRCNFNYRNTPFKSMICYDDSWDYVAICQPECGTLTPQGEPLVLNGVSAKRGELPWYAGIYDKRFKPYQQICGGSLVSTSIVITAAHCFWNDAEGVSPVKYFAVGVGKLYRPWDLKEGEQKSDVSAIKVPVRFSGASANFQSDIALVSLETAVVLAPHIRPVCIDFDERFEKSQLRHGNIGKVAGWGLTSEDGNPSQVLKVAEMPYVDVEQCIAQVPFAFRSYITSDKICAGTKNGTTLCKGDTGAGLVFPQVDGNVQRWYLRGLASTAPMNDHKCNANAYAAFTHLRSHEPFIKKYLTNEFTEKPLHPNVTITASSRLPQVACGMLSGAQTLILDGRKAHLYEMPWHAGIYDKSGEEHKQICGGSLVSHRLVISAAHCFWDDVARQLPPENYAVALGQLKRQWKTGPGQWFDVSSIKLPDEFRGEINGWQADIAMVFLDKPAVYSKNVQLVCLDLDDAGANRKQLAARNVGKVAGWGLTTQDGLPSDDLNVNELHTVSNSQCIDDSHYDFKRYISPDKLCAGNITGNALCEGDSGGGLMFHDEGGPYYLRGIASIRHVTRHRCSNTGYTAFTRVFHYADFIKNNNI